MPPDTSDLDPKQPDGDSHDSGGLPLETAPEPPSESPVAVASAAGVESVEPDDIAELDADDIEALDLDAVAPVRAKPPALPARATPPPPPPARTFEAGESDDVAAISPRPKPTPVAAPVPLEQQLETPTVIEREIAHSRSQRWERRAAELLRELEGVTDKAQIAAVSYELGELYQRRLADDARAVKAYGRALQADPSLRPNLWAIRRVFYDRGLWPNILKLIDAEVRFVRDDGERADLLLEKAYVQLYRLDSAPDAKETLKKACALDATNAAALAALDWVGCADNDNDTRVRALRGLVSATEHPDRRLAYALELVPLQLDIGDIDVHEAFAALDQIGKLELSESSRAALARTREDLADASGDAEVQLSALENRIADRLAECGPAGVPEPRAPRAPGEPLDRATELRLEMAALRRRQAHIARVSLDAPERTWDYLQAALALAPGEPLVLADLAEVAEGLGKYEELAELCQGWESSDAAPARSLSLSLRRADAMLRSGQRPQALSLLDSLSASSPGYLAITSLRERDALANSDWAALAAAYAVAAEAAHLGTSFRAGGASEGTPDPKSAAAYYVAAGDLNANFVADAEAARGFYGLALEVWPGYTPAVEALASMFELTGELTDAAQLFELHAESGSTGHRRYMLERLCGWYEQLGQSVEQLACLRRILSLDPDDVRVRWRIDALLVMHGTAHDRAPALIELAAALTEPAQRSAVLLAAARLYEEELGEASEALSLYKQVLQSSPDDRYAQAAQVTLLRRAGDWADLAETRREMAATMEDGPALSGALREAADVLHHHLGDAKAAAAVYRELLDRSPEDVHAAHGLMSALLDAGDKDAYVEALERTSVDVEDPLARADSLIALGLAQERLGRTADALDSYRRATDVAPERPHAAIAMADLAVKSGDTTGVIDALTTLADTRRDPELRAELLEEVGWLWTVGAGDVDRGLDTFASSVEAAPRAGALLGAALVEAKRGEARELGERLFALAGVIPSSYAGAALVLRSAAIADVAGDAELVRDRVEHALSLAPDDASTLVSACEYLPAGPADHLAPLPRVEGEEEKGEVDATEHAVDQLLGRAERCGMRAAVSGNPDARDDWELDRADTLEVAGRLKEAGAVVMSVLDGRPEDVRALQLLRRICRRADDRRGLAIASLALARVLGDPAGKLELLREAASIFDTERGEVALAVPIYRRILNEDHGASEGNRLLAVYREHGDVRGLVELLGERINWADETDNDSDKVVLLFERALLRQGIGDARGAQRDLATLLVVDDAHADALSTQAALLSEAGDHQGAARLLQRLLEIEADPTKRAAAELFLSEILAENMDDVAGAVAQLEHVIEQSPSDVKVRERMVSLLSRAGEWSRMVRELREVERLRESAAERARDELRIAAVLRDNVNDAVKARAALERARQLDPLNVDAVRDLADLVSKTGDGRARRKVLGHAAADIRDAIRGEPEAAAHYERLAVIAQWLADKDTRFFALSALGVLRSLTAEQKSFVAERKRAAAESSSAPSVTMNEETWRSSVAHPASGGVASAVWRTVGEAVAKLSGFEPSRAGFGRGQKLSTKGLARSHKQLAEIAGAFALGDYDLYVANARPGTARVVSSQGKAAVFLGSDIAKADTPAARFTLARAFAHVREGTGSLAQLRDSEVQLLFAASAQLAGVKPASVAEILTVDRKEVEEQARTLQKAMGRRERKQLSQLGASLESLPDPLVWRRAAVATATRAALLFAGDLAVGLDMLDVGRGGRSITDDRSALALLAWAVSDAHIALRKALGMFD